MKKLTDSLPATVIAGLVLTVIMVLIAPGIAGSGDPVSDAAEKVQEQLQGE